MRREQEKVGEFSQPRFFPGLTPRRAQIGRVQRENKTIHKRVNLSKIGRLHIQHVPFSLDLLLSEVTPPIKDTGPIIDVEEVEAVTFNTTSQGVRNFVQSLPDNIMLHQTPAQWVHEDRDAPTVFDCIQTLPNHILPPQTPEAEHHDG